MKTLYKGYEIELKTTDRQRLYIDGTMVLSIGEGVEVKLNPDGSETVAPRSSSISETEATGYAEELIDAQEVK